jgi:hypothetical protein
MNGVNPEVTGVYGRLTGALRKVNRGFTEG